MNRTMQFQQDRRQQQHLLNMMLQARQQQHGGGAAAPASPASERPTIAGDNTNNKPAFYTRLGPNDVLLGRGTPCAENEGNIRFRTLVRQRKQEYVAAEKRVRKDAIAREILLVIEGEREGKFLRKVEHKTEREALGIPKQVKDVWVVVDEETKVQKVKQALRNKDDSAEAVTEETAKTAAFGAVDSPAFPAAAHAHASHNLNQSLPSLRDNNAVSANNFPRVGGAGGGIGRGASGQAERVLGKADFSVKLDSPNSLENATTSRRSSDSSTGSSKKAKILLLEAAKSLGKTKTDDKSKKIKLDAAPENKKKTKNPKKKRMDYYEQALKEQRARGVDDTNKEDSEDSEDEAQIIPQATVKDTSSPAMMAAGGGLNRIPNMMMAPNLASMQQHQRQQQALNIPPQGHPGVTNVALMRMKAAAAENVRRNSLLQPGSASSTPMQTPEGMQRALLAGGTGGLASQAPLPMLSPANTTNMANPFMRGGGVGPRFGAVGAPGMQHLQQQMNAGRSGMAAAGVNKPFSPAFSDMLSDARRNMEFQKMQAQQVAAAMASVGRSSMGPPSMASQDLSHQSVGGMAGGPYPMMRGSTSDHMALRGSALGAGEMARRGSAMMAGNMDASASGGGPHMRRLQGITSGDSTGERALGVGVAMKRAEAFSVTESLQLAHSETMILSLLCSRGLPVWAPNTASESFYSAPRSDAAGMLKFTWRDFANALVVKANAWGQKMEDDRDPHPRDARIMERAVALAKHYQNDPKELAKKSIMLLEKLRRHGVSGAVGQQKQWSGIGMRVPLWLERELARWGMTLGVCDPTGRPVPCSVADFLVDHPEFSDDDAMVSTTALDAILTGDVFDQIALLTRLRAVFRRNGRTEMWSKLAGAVHKSEASGEVWGAQPNWWGLPNNDDASRLSHEMLLLGRLLVSGFSGVLSSTSDGINDRQNNQDSVHHPSFESLGLTKSAIQQRACQITRELHLIEESAHMNNLLEERMAKMTEIVSAGIESSNKKAQADAALRLLAGATEAASPSIRPTQRASLTGMTDNDDAKSKKRKFDS